MAKFFPVSGYSSDLLGNKETIDKRINLLKKHGFKENKSIHFWLNTNQKKVFKLETLTSLDDETLKEKIQMTNNTENWIVFTIKGNLFLSEEDVKYMFGYK